MGSMSEWILIGELVKCSGFVVSVLCFYEVVGLLESQCSGLGWCYYLCYVLWCVVFICVVQVVGLLLDDICVVLVFLLDGCMFNVVDWQCLFCGWCLLLDECIVVFMVLCDWFSFCIGCGCLLLIKCVLYNLVDQVVVKGMGLCYLMGDKFLVVED